MENIKSRKHELVKFFICNYDYHLLVITISDNTYMSTLHKSLPP